MTPAALLLTIAFTFPTPDGSRLLATSKVNQPATLRAALCSGAQRVAVAFERAQPEGSVFRIAGPPIDAGATCLLADDAFLDGTTPITLARPRTGTRCLPSWYPSFQAARSRPVVACWPIAEGTDTHVAVVEFSRWLSRALASLVVVDGERRIYVDYPAEFRGPGADLWRANDGGEVHAEGFDVLFLLKRGQEYLLGLDWRSAEGSALTVLTSEGDAFKELLRDFRYPVPQ